MTAFARGLIIHKSYNSNRIVEMAFHRLRACVKIVICKQIFRGRRDANMSGGGAPRKTAGCKLAEYDWRWRAGGEVTAAPGT
jgi:hypothetical protein